MQIIFKKKKSSKIAILFFVLKHSEKRTNITINILMFVFLLTLETMVAKLNMDLQIV